MEFSYSTILGKITKKIDITKFLYIHFYKKKLCNRLHAPPFPPTHKSQIPIDGGIRGMKRTKKAATVGMWGLTPLRGQANGYKSRKRVFAIISPLTCHGGSRCSPLTHPSPYRKKSRFAKKKSAPPKKNTPAAYILLGMEIIITTFVIETVWQTFI